MNWSGLPPLNSLKSFAAVAETGSYMKAGSLLNVTQAAVSQQVRSLEDRLETSLVVRDGRGIRLTVEGLALAHDLDTGFATILRGLDRVREDNSRHPVQLSTSPAFAVEWLMPRIQDFQTRYPDIPLLLNPTSQVVDLKPGAIEVAIRYKTAGKADTLSLPVLVSDMVVVAAPSLLGSGEIDDPAMLMDVPWLQELGTNEVADWFALQGVKLERPLMITQMPGNLIMQAVRRGHGVTFTARAFFEEEIQSGSIRVLFSESAFGIYYIETMAGTLRKSVNAFVDWLKEEAATDSIHES